MAAGLIRRVVRRRFSAFTVVIITLIVGLTIAPGSVFPADLNAAVPVLDTSSAQKLFDTINGARESAGLRTLIAEPASEAAASSHAMELSQRRVLSHTGLDGDRVVERYRQAEGTGLKAGEILGAGDSAEHIFDAWMESERHKEVLLNTEWWKMGISCYRLENERLLSVVVFSSSRWKTTSYSYSNDRTALILNGIMLHDPQNVTQSYSVFAFNTFHSPNAVKRVNGQRSELRFVIPFRRSPDAPVKNIKRGREEVSLTFLKIYRNEGGFARQTDLILLLPPD